MTLTHQTEVAPPDGFIDLQVNGFKGFGFSNGNLSLDTIRHITNELLRRGTVAYCPTLCTSDTLVYVKNLPVLAKAVKSPELQPHLLGIHIEGPFFAPVSRGAHSESLLRLPDIDIFDRWQELADGQIRILTLAPELEGAEELIRHASKQGVIVSLGHHLADDAAVQRAVKAGATCCTHVGNGIPQNLPRHPNPIWSQLSHDSLVNMFITDGHHLPDDFIRIALRAKTVNRFIVASDSSAQAGLPPGRYGKNGCVVLEPSGRLSLANGWSLAGSSSAMIDCMNHLGSLGILSEDDLWQVGAGNALQLLGNPSIGKLPGGRLRTGKNGPKITFLPPGNLS